jgi:hypothetical protein
MHGAARKASYESDLMRVLLGVKLPRFRGKHTAASVSVRQMNTTASTWCQYATQAPVEHSCRPRGGTVCNAVCAYRGMHALTAFESGSLPRY